MPDIVIGSATTEHIARFIDAIAGRYGYREMIDGEPNPETKRDFAERKLRRQFVVWTKKYERQAAIDALVTDEIDIT